MTVASRSLRRIEIALWIFGLSLLGVALGATVHRWSYQAEQDRAFDRVAAGAVTPEGADPFVQPPEGQAGGEPPTEASSGLVAGVENSKTEVVHPSEIAPTPRRAAAPRPTLEDQIALDPAVIGRIEIPRLRLQAMVREGEDESTLDKAIGWLPDTARPGEGGNTALAGHRDTFFRSLQRIREDDRIRLVVPPNTYEYRVASLRVVGPDDLSVLSSTGVEELTLITCHPFRLIGPAPDRFIVKATRVQ